MKSQVLLTVWCNISGEAAGEIWHWSLLGVKGLKPWQNGTIPSRASSSQPLVHLDKTELLVLDRVGLTLFLVRLATSTNSRQLSPSCLLLLATARTYSHNWIFFYWPAASAVEVPFGHPSELWFLNLARSLAWVDRSLAAADGPSNFLVLKADRATSVRGSRCRLSVGDRRGLSVRILWIAWRECVNAVTVGEPPCIFWQATWDWTETPCSKWEIRPALPALRARGVYHQAATSQYRDWDAIFNASKIIFTWTRCELCLWDGVLDWAKYLKCWDFRRFDFRRSIGSGRRSSKQHRLTFTNCLGRNTMIFFVPYCLALGQKQDKRLLWKPTVLLTLHHPMTSWLDVIRFSWFGSVVLLSRTPTSREREAKRYALLGEHGSDQPLSSPRETSLSVFDPHLSSLYRIALASPPVLLISLSLSLSAG